MQETWGIQLSNQRDHGGRIDSAVARFGGKRADWIDLSTGINPVPYPFRSVSSDAWTALPDLHAHKQLVSAARRFWQVPQEAAIFPVPGASAAIAHIPRLAETGSVHIPGPTYNEHAAAFSAQGWSVTESDASTANAQVIVHPNNPTGYLWAAQDLAAPLRIIDESFCDVTPAHSLVALATQPGTLILKSFGKFWGLAGLRLGFVIGDPELVAKLADILGPWPVSGIALDLGAQALEDEEWAETTRNRLTHDARRLDQVVAQANATLIGGTTLFRLYRVEDAAALQTRLAQHHIWSRTFPYASDWIRLGLPPEDGWHRVENAL